MKIEKINDDQIRFLLTTDDLKERKIKLSELAKGSEKAQLFFRDIMTEAMIDYGFDASNTPLMIEAMSISADSIIIIVSKVNTKAELEQETISSLMPKSLEERKFKQIEVKIIKDEPIENSINEENFSIYSFNTLQDVINLSTRLKNLFEVKSMLYKFDDKYFIVIIKNTSFIDNLDYIASEYGQKHVSTIISKVHLDEHAEVIIKENAINILANL